MGLKEPIQKIFLLPVVTISEKLYDASLFLHRMKSRAYKVRKLNISVKKGDPSSFLLCLLKTSNIIRLKYAQNHSESTFGLAYFKPKKS